MGNFQLKIDVEPNDIPSLDDPHKQDCADAINRIINGTFKYTMIFAFAVMGVYAAYSIFGLVYVLRMGVPLPSISPLIPLFAMFVIIFELVAGTMKRWAIVTEVILHIALMICSVTQIASLLALPFAAYGIYLHIKMMTLIPHYEVISNLKGFPDFTSLPIGEVVKKADTDKDAVPENQESISPEKASPDNIVQENDKPEEQPVPANEENSGTKENSSPENESEAPAETDPADKKPDTAEKTEPAIEEKDSPKEENDSSAEEKNSGEKNEAPTEEKASAEEKQDSPEEKSVSAAENVQPRKSNNSSRKKKKRKKSSK